MMKAELSKDGNTLVLAVPFDKVGRDSKAGKSILHFTTSGAESIVIDGKVVKVNINIYSPK